MIWWHMVRVSFMQCFLATRFLSASFPPLPSLYCYVYVFSTYFFHRDSYLFCFLLIRAHGWVAPLCQPWGAIFNLWGCHKTKPLIPWTCTQPPSSHAVVYNFNLILELILTCRMLIQINLSVPYWGIKTSCLYDTS